MKDSSEAGEGKFPAEFFTSSRTETPEKLSGERKKVSKMKIFPQIKMSIGPLPLP